MEGPETSAPDWGRTRAGTRATSAFVGAIVLGVWGWLVLMSRGGDPIGPILLWGGFGFAMAAGVYGVRASPSPLRLPLLIALGLAVGAVVAATFWGRMDDGFSALVTFTGASLIAVALPAPGRDRQPGAPASAP